MKYNKNLKYDYYKYESGAVALDLWDLDDMNGKIIAEWSMDYAKKQMLMALAKATGIKGGWSFSFISQSPSKHDESINIYEFCIDSRLYTNLRRIYEKTLDK